MADYYSVLGVDKNAKPEDIKKAFRKLAHKYHPDKQGGDEKKFKEINEAYQVLNDQKKRAQYDQFGQVFGEGQNQGQGFGGFDFSSFNQGNFSGINLDDILENIGFNFGFGSSRKQRKRDLNRGDDIEIAMEIILEDTIKGVEETVVLDKMMVCERCEGTGGEPNSKIKECFACRGKGWVEQVKRTILGTISQQAVCPECNGQGKIPEKPCNVCKGEGRTKQKQKIKVSIPAGIDNGQTLKITGQGDAGKRQGPAGDLLIKVFVKQHKIFQRRGDDIIAGINIPFSTAVLGGEISVPDLENKNLRLKISPGTQAGKIFRLSNRGIPHFQGWGRGALFVELNIDTPKKLNKEQKDLLKKLAKQGL